MEKINQKQLADRWKMTPYTIRRWGQNGFGPPFSKEGVNVFYKISDVIFFDKNKVVGDDFISNKDLADKLQVSIKTIQRWGRQKLGPKQYRIHGKTFYKKEDVEIYEYECNIRQRKIVNLKGRGLK